MERKLRLWFFVKRRSIPSIFKDRYYLSLLRQQVFTSQDCTTGSFMNSARICPFMIMPDVRAVGEYSTSASKRFENCSFFRTKDPLTVYLRKLKDFVLGSELFLDDDGRLYFYWGCSNVEPIYGVELDPETMRPLTEPIVLIDSCDQERGYERTGEDHIPPKTEAEIEQQVEMMLAQAKKAAEMQNQINAGMSEEGLRKMLYGYMSNKPYIEGAWMTKYKGKYYLQYAIPGTQYNTYGDGVYIGESPLGPFMPAKNNPYSYKPGGFITGAGHGSTLKDQEGRFWHISTMRISHNHDFERRLGLWKADLMKMVSSSVIKDMEIGQ